MTIMTARRARASVTTPRVMEWSSASPAGARRNRTCPITRRMARRSAKRPRKRSVDVERRDCRSRPCAPSLPPRSSRGALPLVRPPAPGLRLIRDGITLYMI